MGWTGRWETLKSQTKIALIQLGPTDQPTPSTGQSHVAFLRVSDICMYVHAPLPLASYAARGKTLPRISTPYA